METPEQGTNWYSTKGAGRGQGLVIDEADGRNVAVAYDEKDAPLLAAAPRLREALDRLLAATVDDDLSHGIALTEKEEEARQFALAALAEAAGETYEAPEADEDNEDDLRP